MALSTTGGDASQEDAQQPAIAAAVKAGKLHPEAFSY